MADGHEPATVRRLPEGQGHAAMASEPDGRQIAVTLCDPAELTRFPAGSIVELESDAALYLGEVGPLRKDGFVLLIEHLITRASLSSLGDVWRRTAG